MAVKRIINGGIWLGFAVAVLVSMSLTGCSPKRVLGTGTTQEVATAQEPASQNKAQDFQPEDFPDNASGDPAPGLPEPEHRVRHRIRYTTEIK